MEQQLERLRHWWEGLHPWVVVKFSRGASEANSFYWNRSNADEYVRRVTKLNEDPKTGLPSHYRPEYRTMTREAWIALQAEKTKHHR